jgi:hypothetical protein
MLPAELHFRIIAGQVLYQKFSYVYADGSTVPVLSQATRVRYVIRRYPWPPPLDSLEPDDPIILVDEGNYPGELDMFTLADTLPNIELRIPSMVTELWPPGTYVHELDYLYPFGTPPTPDWQEKIFRGAISIFPAYMPVPELIP